MRTISWKLLINEGPYLYTNGFERVSRDIGEAISEVVWPPGSTNFTIYPEPGTGPGEGNGWVPLKDRFAEALQARGWQLENRATLDELGPQLSFSFESFPGPRAKPFVARWETGNMGYGRESAMRILARIRFGHIAGGVLIVPTQELARYLTDSVATEPDLRPHYDHWKEWQMPSYCHFSIVSIEHDATSVHVPKIPNRD